MSLTFITPIMVSVTGIYLLIKLHFFFFIKPFKTLKMFVSSLRHKENRGSLCLALAGTLGVGNIFGVAAGIMIGGAGSVLWLLLSSIFSSVIKYCEALLTTDYFMNKKGGMQLVIKGTFKKTGGFLSYLYSVLCLLLAFFMGAAMQSRAAYDLSREALNISPWIFIPFFLTLIIISVSGGGDKIEKINTFVIPTTTIIYIIMSLSVVFCNFSRLGNAIELIVFDAFSTSSFAAGIGMFLFSRGLKEGFCRGILSNEAGVGTSAFAHSRAEKREPSIAGLYGMCEVFFDTVLLCPLTALMILTSVGDLERFKTPMALVSFSVESVFGVGGKIVLAILVLSFAFATVSCWFYYGTECTLYLFKGKFKLLFSLVFISFVSFGIFIPDAPLLAATDVIILFMSVLTLSVIVKEHKRIVTLTKASGLIK